MKVVIASDSFKESLSAREVVSLIEAGFREVFPDWTYVQMPVADGGEGTVDALVAATNGRHVTHEVTGPLGDRVQAFFGLTGDGRTAVIEMAAAGGLMLLPLKRRDPMRTSTYGVGELIRRALDLGARHFVVGLGGSATNDGGAGMAHALGAQFLDARGDPIGPGGAALSSLAHIDVSGIDPRLSECEIEVACDVDSPLCGPTGASAVFGPQKGATTAMVRRLDASLLHYAQCIRRDLGVDVADLGGGGAAGGLGAGLVAFTGAVLRPGAQIVFDAVGLEQHVRDADLVITGEGRIDGQSIHGKTPVAVAALGKRYAKPVIALTGAIGEGADLLLDHGIDAMFSIVPFPCSLEDALAQAETNMLRASRNVAMSIKVGRDLRAGGFVARA